MLDTISVVTVNSSYNSIYSVAKVVTQYGSEYVLNQEQTKDYLLNHYSLGYTTFASYSKPTGLMPPGVKAIFPNVVVFERPPTYQNIFYIADTVSERMSEEQHVYRVALPWQLYVAVYNSDFYLTNVYMYFMDAPLTSVKQNIYAPNIPNFFANGLLCRPNFSTMEDVERYSKDVSGVIHSTFDWVWNNGTNHDLTESMVLLPKYTEDISTTVIGRLPISGHYFDKSFCNSYRLSETQVKTAFSSWEKIDIKDILDYKWVSPSTQLHDVSSGDYISSIQESSAYSDYLQDWLFNNYSDEDEEDIINRMDNGEYDISEYISFLINNNYVSPPLDKRSDFSYEQMLNSIFAENNTLRRKTVNILSDIKKITEILKPVS